MRAPLARSSFTPTHVLCWAAALGVSGLGFIACGDSLHLDPGGDGGKTTTTGTTSATTTASGTGGSTQMGCQSNQDCGFAQPICDTIAGTCVECLTISDCVISKPGTVCNFGACECATTDGGPTLTYCAEANGGGHCADTQTASNDCGTCGKTCFGACSAGACLDKWRPITTVGAPAARSRHVSVWAKAAARMFVWGGRSGGTALDTGGLYDPAKDAWKATSPLNAPSPRSGATAVWDDQENVVIVWGGLGANGQPLDDGGMYNPTTDQWTSIPPSGLAPRNEHTAVWATFTTPFAGASYGMMIWGGTAGATHFADGAFFDPSPGKMAWTALPNGGPSPRGDHTAVWNAGTNVMIIVGGFGGPTAPDTYLADAWALDPLQATPWTDLASTLTARARHTAVFGSAGVANPFMIAFGGANATSQLPDGAIYRANNWSALDPFNFPEEREAHTAVWLDPPVTPPVGRMVVLGGIQGGTTLGTAWSLDPLASPPTWTKLPSPPGVRAYHTAVTDGASMLAWGGEASGAPLGTGVIYTP